jgi:hypothetical protein
MPTFTRLIKTLDFTEDQRNRVILGADVRLNPQANRLELKPDLDGKYPLAPADAIARTWLTKPRAVKKWLLLESVLTTPTGTSAMYRLSANGVDDLVWDTGTSAWVVTTSAWNTEAEVCDNIATFPISTKSIQVVIKLATSNALVTPAVEAIKILYDAQIDFQLDLFARSLLREMSLKARALSDHPIVLSASGVTINLGSYPVSTPYKIIGIDAVYNHTDDPQHDLDLFQSYNPTTKVITLSSSLAAGKTAWILFQYEPEVMMSTARDWVELAKVPSLVVNEIESVAFRPGQGDDTVINKRTSSGWRVQAPNAYDFDFTIRITTDKAGDQHRLSEKVRQWLRLNPLLTSYGLDEPYRLLITRDYLGSGTTNQEEIHSGTMRVRLCGALFFDRPATPAVSVQRFTILTTP